MAAALRSACSPAKCSAQTSRQSATWSTVCHGVSVPPQSKMTARTTMIHILCGQLSWGGKQSMSAQAEQETHRFQAEVVQILDLMIHSLYSNKEIFLRELISNSSDAIDRLRLEHMTRPELGDIPSPLQIRVSFDAESRTITVEDDGIGMTRQEVIENIGTIAKSGTREFLGSLTGDQQKDATLIGQFGVGFYSSFIV